MFDKPNSTQANQTQLWKILRNITNTKTSGIIIFMKLSESFGG